MPISAAELLQDLDTAMAGAAVSSGALQRICRHLTEKYVLTKAAMTFQMDVLIPGVPPDVNLAGKMIWNQVTGLFELTQDSGEDLGTFSLSQLAEAITSNRWNVSNVRIA